MVFCPLANCPFVPLAHWHFYLVPTLLHRDFTPLQKKNDSQSSLLGFKFQLSSRGWLHTRVETLHVQRSKFLIIMSKHFVKGSFVTKIFMRLYLKL